MTAPAPSPDYPDDLAAALARLPVAAYACDRDGLVTCFNGHAERMWGCAPALRDPRNRFGAVGAMLARDGTPIATSDAPAARAIGDGCEVAGVEMTLQHADGRRIDALLHAVPLRDASDAVAGALCAMVDVTERAQRERTREEFMAMLGHELRNPLGPVRNAVHILRGCTRAEPQALWALDLIERQVDELVGVIEIVSEVSRLARGKIRPARAPYLVADVVDGAVEATRAVLAHRQQRCEVALPARDLRAEGDAARAERALLMVVRSASKSLPTGATLALDVRVDTDRVDFEIGSPAGSSSLLPSEGAIGLTLARALAEVLGGTLVVDPTRYELSLPRN